VVKPHDFLSDSKYDRLELDIVYVDGFRPTDQTVAHIESFLEARLNKPSGIAVSFNSISSPGKSYYTKDDLDKIEKDDRTLFTKGNKLTTFIFFADAPSSEVIQIPARRTIGSLWLSTASSLKGDIS